MSHGLRTGASVQAEVCARDLNGGSTRVEDPILGASSVAVVTSVASCVSSNSYRPSEMQNAHLDGRAVGIDSTLDIETLGRVTVRVKLVRT